MDEFFQQLGVLFSWGNLATFLNSNFTSALTGALAGAFAGAFAAQRIADRSQRKRQFIEEIRGVNAATVVAFSLCSATINFKKQQVVDVAAEYQRSRRAFLAHQDQIARGTPPASAVFQLRADFRDLQMPLLPIETLRTQVYEKITAPSRALTLVATLAGSIDALVGVMNKRNMLIERFRKLGERDPLLLPLYFGTSYGGGHLSTEFLDCVEGMQHLTDDIIFFSELLANDIHEHGQKTLDTYRKLEKKTKLRIATADFSNVRALGLMPDPANYDDWLNRFKPAAQQAAAPDAQTRAGERER